MTRSSYDRPAVASPNFAVSGRAFTNPDRACRRAVEGEERFAALLWSVWRATDDREPAPSRTGASS